jgi:hypothetical protein
MLPSLLYMELQTIQELQLPCVSPAHAHEGHTGGCELLRALAAQVPYTDAFMLRTFSADAPLEGRSSFAVEMQEMRSVLP